MTVVTTGLALFSIWKRRLDFIFQRFLNIHPRRASYLKHCAAGRAPYCFMAPQCEQSQPGTDDGRCAHQVCELENRFAISLTSLSGVSGNLSSSVTRPLIRDTRKWR